MIAALALRFRCLPFLGLLFAVVSFAAWGYDAHPRANGILKSEYGLGREFRTKAEGRLAVKQAVYLYNTRRPHTALNFRVPSEVHSLVE